MSHRDQQYEDADGNIDPELLYTKEYCIGQCPFGPWPKTRELSVAVLLTLTIGGGSFGKVYKGCVCCFLRSFGRGRAY